MLLTVKVKLLPNNEQKQQLNAYLKQNDLLQKVYDHNSTEVEIQNLEKPFDFINEEQQRRYKFYKIGRAHV